MESLSDCPLRQALCGNVFPGDDLASVLEALRGPVQDWSSQVGSCPGFGLYLSAPAVAETLASADRVASLGTALIEAKVEVWTANAFPFAGFHGTDVKKKAFLPDWRDPRRLEYTTNMAVLLASLCQAGSQVSVSSCPLGYGKAVRQDVLALNHLRQAQEFLLRLEEDTGIKVILGLEPEPDGAIELATEMPQWLQAEVLGDVPVADRRVGLCWDLCHSAVVGESSAAILESLERNQIPLAKIQVSSALIAQDPSNPSCRERLRALAEDPWFHQVRAGVGLETTGQWPDLAFALEDPSAAARGPWRIHCHVPIHQDDYGQGFLGTEWRAPLQMALEHGCSDFELETYTLPVLPPGWLESQGLVGTLVAETRALAATLADFPLAT